MSYSISLSGLPNATLTAPEATKIAAGDMALIPVTVIADGYELKRKSTPIEFTISSDQEASIVITKSSYFYKN